ncbi:WD repeat-containing protein 36, partial [Araneus ventricosus]
MKTRYNSRATDHHFKDGDLVWMYNPKRWRGMSPKLQQNWEGPYTVQETEQCCPQSTELKHVYKGPKENVLLLLPFGPHLIAVYEDSTLIVWDIKAEEITAEIPFTNISISAIVHPSTYLNKILLGSLQGCLQLWNLRTNKLIYTFDGWGSPVTVLEQAPAINVVAVGLECGDIYIHNLKFDETLMKFSQDWGAVTGLSFRT